MYRRERINALERHRTAAPVAIEIQRPDETEDDSRERLLANHGDPPRCKLITLIREPD